MILPIYVYGQPVLRKIAENVTKDYPNLEKIIADMWETMENSDGVGLAAPQIGKSIRIFTIDASHFAEDDPKAEGFRKTFINAQILSREGEEVLFNEGCLSVPGIREDIKRPSIVTIRFVDENFVEHEETYDGIRARVVQHEYDHIEGKLMIDHLKPLKKTLLKRKLNDISKGIVDVDYKIRAVK